MFGDLVREGRARVGMTREKLATECGTSYGVIALIEQGKRPATVAMLSRICRILDIDVTVAVCAAGETA